MSNLPPIREIVQKYGINADKKLGQNFLFDLNITNKIATATGSLEGVTVIEIGPGPGGLTRSILNAGAEKVFAVEMDRRCIHALNDYLVPESGGRLTIIEGDALRSDIYDKLEGRVRIIANLPYNISTELLFKWLDNANSFESMTLMFQKEVAERIAAKPGSKEYGRISVKAQWLCEVRTEFDVPPTVFFPPPKVYSRVVTLIPHAKPLFSADKDMLEKLCKAAFGQRRKALRVSLKQICDNPSLLLEKAGIDGMRRPEELTVEEFCKLAGCLKEA